MPKTITPLDDSFQAPEQLPDRSDLVEVYGKPLERTGPPLTVNPPRKEEDVITPSGLQLFKNAVLANALLMIPYIASFLSIVAIFGLGESRSVEEAAFNRFSMIILAVPALVPWPLAIYLLDRIVHTYRVGLSKFLMVYMFFFLPIINLGINLHLAGTREVVILISTVLLSQVYILFAFHALTRQTVGWVKYRAVISMAVIIAIFSIFL